MDRLLKNNLVSLQLIQTFSDLANHGSIFYYTNHTKYIAMISRDIAFGLELSDEKIRTTVLSALFYGSIISGLPSRYVLNNPEDFEDLDEKTKYFETYDNAVNIITRHPDLRHHARIIAQVWEHYDGSGLPNGVPGDQIEIEAQIVSIANYYHNIVYRLTESEFKQLKQVGRIIQTSKETYRKHDAAIKYMFKNTRWFDKDVLNEFHDLAKLRKSRALIPKEIDLELTLLDGDSIVKKEDDNGEDSEENKGSDDFGVVNTKDDEDDFVEADLEVSELKSGMIVGQNVVTKKGMLIVRMNNTLDKKLIKNIQQLSDSGLLDSYLTVYIPKEDNRS